MWDNFDQERVLSLITQASEQPIYLDEPPGSFWIASGYLYACDLILEGFPESLQDRVRDCILVPEEVEDAFTEIDTFFSPQDVTELQCDADLALVTLLEKPKLRKRLKRETLIDCWIEDSMVSSIWSIYEVRGSDRGYLFYSLGEDMWEDKQLLGCWEPVDNPAARYKCIIESYAAHWSSHCLPPEMGECAEGEQPLFFGVLA